MSELSSILRPLATRSYLPVAALAIGLGALQGGSTARAGAIHHHAAKAVVTEESEAVSAEAVMDSWEPYFAQALKTHQMHVRGPNALKLLSVMAKAEGGLPDNSFVQYLEWRHGLNPVRFDAVHPLLGPMLEKLHFVTTETSTPTPTVSPTESGPPTLSGGSLLPSHKTPLLPPILAPPEFGPQSLGPPPTVPEPSSCLIAMILIGSAGLLRRKRRPRQTV